MHFVDHFDLKLFVRECRDWACPGRRGGLCCVVADVWTAAGGEMGEFVERVSP